MDRETVRNMQSSIPKIIWEISASRWFYYKNGSASILLFHGL